MNRLKSRLRFNIAIFIVAITAGAAGACSLFTSKNVQTALDIAKVLCVIANAESDDRTVKTVCGIVDAEEAAFRSVRMEQRNASRRFAAAKAACTQDAGSSTGDAGLR